MSSGSESSLAELPQPYDISSAVSKALHVSTTVHGAEGETVRPKPSRARTLSYPGYYDFPAHSSSASAYSENYAAGYYCGTPYYFSPSVSAAAAVAAAAAAVATDPPQQYLYPHHYASIHPAEAHVQMEVEAWSESTTMSICNSTTDLSLESKVNMEQLDQFCKYIDSSGDEELISEKAERSMFSSAGKDYRGYSARAMSRSAAEYSKESPPRKKRRSTCPVSISGYYEEDFEEDEDEDGARNWKVELDNSCMWKEFDSVGTEMVITKAGRRMFPTLCLKVRGLDPTEVYSVKLDILSADNKRYKYLQTEWVAVGRSDKKQIHRQYEHPDSPNSGSYWMDKIIAFKMVKLTNNKTTKSPDQVILNSMHKYIPCTRITCEKDGYTESFSFPETTFIAVTAYQSTGVTQLKINNNPYARAFRESIPSISSQKRGGHCRNLAAIRRNSTPSPNQGQGHRNNGSRNTTPSSSPNQQASQGKQKANCNSTVSVESGFESDSAVDKKKEPTSFIMSQNNPFHSGSLVTYWSDDNSLWNPHLITPDPLVETPHTFTAYLDDTSIETECEVVDDSGDNSDGSATDILQPLPRPGIELANVEADMRTDDDVFF